MPPSWFATGVNGAWAEGRMWCEIEHTMILYFAHLLVFFFAGKAANVVRKNASQVCCRGMYIARQETYRYCASYYTIRFMAMIVRKQRNVESDWSISWKRNVQSGSRLNFAIARSYGSTLLKFPLYNTTWSGVHEHEWNNKKVEWANRERPMYKCHEP